MGAQGRDVSNTAAERQPVFAWNADKAYLVDLATTCRAYPPGCWTTRPWFRPRGGARPRGRRRGRQAAHAGPGGVGVVVVAAPDERLEGLGAAPWVVQPLVESVRTTGETSVYVLARPGRLPGRQAVAGDASEIRVHQTYGGRAGGVPLDPGPPAIAEPACRTVAARTVGRSPPMPASTCCEWEEEWAVSELELIEPGPLPRRRPGYRAPVR